MNKFSLKMVVCLAAMMMQAMTFAETTDSLSTDSTLWYNQTQQLGEVVIKSSLPKTKLKGNSLVTLMAMRA
jgi:hypothetical protein